MHLPWNSPLQLILVFILVAVSSTPVYSEDVTTVVADVSADLAGVDAGAVTEAAAAAGAATAATEVEVEEDTVAGVAAATATDAGAPGGDGAVGTDAPPGGSTDGDDTGVADATVGVPDPQTDGAAAATEADTSGGAVVGATTGDQVPAQTSKDDSGVVQPAPTTPGHTDIVVVATTRGPPEATYTVTSITVMPYLMVNGTDGGYTGYVMDVLNSLRDIMNVEFKLKIVSDGRYGRKNGDEWTGMIGEVVRGEADLAAAPLTVTVDREDVVDFTHPFISYSAAAVIKKKSKFSHPQTESLDDLVEQGYTFGVVKESNIYKVLKTSRDALHKKVLANIDEHNKFEASNNAGITQARQDSKYAFLMESTSADWIAHQEPCDLGVITTQIYKRKYAFAVKNYSYLRDKFNRAILMMRDQGKLEELQDKWFRPQTCGACSIFGSHIVSTLVLLLMCVQRFLF